MNVRCSLIFVLSQAAAGFSCAPPNPQPIITCEADQFLMTTCGDAACVSLPEPCLEQITCECLETTPVCEGEGCSDKQTQAAFALESYTNICSARGDGLLVIDVPPIDYC